MRSGAARAGPPARATMHAGARAWYHRGMPKKKPLRTTRATREAKQAPAAQRSRSAREFERVAFTMFPVQDARRARDFYERVLGFERGLASPDGVWTEYDLPGGGCLALFRHPDPAQASPPGGASIAFEVADLDALNERLSAAGVEYQGGVVHGPTCRMSHIQDSEGNSIILHECAPERSARRAR